MQHTIPVDTLGPSGEAMATAIEKCVHCGFCLPTCPTYTVMGEEMDSPRGRIVLMKTVLEGDLELEEALPYLDRCLGCLACVTACPSGVRYGDLVTPFRFHAQESRRRPLLERTARRLTLETLPYPERFRFSASTGRLAKPAKGLFPEPFQAMLELLPDSLPASRPLPEVFPAQGARRARVAFLAGCVQQTLAPEINWATLRVLSANGVEVIIPAGQSCCGALALHAGELNSARSLAINNIRVFSSEVDAIVTNAAGCGSGMKEYPLLFKGTQWETQVEEFANRVQDISEFLVELGLQKPYALNEPMQVAYHDACHLAHAQGITAAPRQLLAQIPNLTILPIAEAELCCGSAGTYNIEQPETAGKLGERKARHILNSGAQAVITGNIGCLVQIRNHISKLGQAIPVWHTLEFLDRAYREVS